MRVSLDRICITRGNFSLAADGTFDKGVHLVSGAVGSGKSTLALCLAGMLPPERGTIQRSGLNIMDPAFDASTFSKNKERLLRQEVARRLCGEVDWWYEKDAAEDAVRKLAGVVVGITQQPDSY